MNVCGVYMILCLASGKFYIGSSLKIEQRWSEHKMSLRLGNHYNKYYQKTWNKYGEQAFVYMVLEPCEPEVRLQREQFYLWASDRKHLLNLSMIATYPEGTSEVLAGRSVRAKQQHAEGRFGRATWPPGFQPKTGKPKGFVPTPESVQKMVETKKNVEWQRPGRRERQAEIARDLQNRPGFKEQIAIRTAAYWTPERRAEQAERARLQGLGTYVRGDL